MIAEALLAGAVAGCASVPHCGAMCGPLAAFACSRRARGASMWRYQAGRLVGYGALGVVAGTVGGTAAALIAGPWWAALVSWALASALAVAALRSWQLAGPQKRERAPSRVELRPWAEQAPSLFERVAAALPREPAAFGAATALLPCGALAASAGLAATTGSAVGGLVTMLAFAAVSGSALLAAAWLARRFAGATRRSWQRVLAVVLVVGAAVLVARPVPALLAGGPAPCHGGSIERAPGR